MYRRAVEHEVIDARHGVRRSPRLVLVICLSSIDTLSAWLISLCDSCLTTCWERDQAHAHRFYHRDLTGVTTLCWQDL